jgi:LuxR family transcriptional regulator, maltose regulon positive regulatory protein
MAMQASAGGAAAERLIVDMYDALSNKTDSFALRLLMTQCIIAFFSADLQRQSQVAQVLYEQLSHNPLPLLEDWSFYFRAVASYDRNDLADAQQHFLEISEDRYVAQATILRDALCGLALIHHAAGRSAAAAGVLNDLVAFDVQLQGQADARTRSLQAHLLLLQGKTAEAMHWATSFTEPPPERPLIWLEEPQVTRAHILAVQGGPAAQQALAVLDILTRTAARTRNGRAMIKLQALRAVALEALGRHDDAESALRQAVDLAAPGGFVRVFLDIGPRLQAILERLARATAAPSYAQILLAAFPTPGAGDHNPSAGSQRRPPVVAGSLVEPLTRRELEIMTLLGEPISPKEMAARLDISYLTVKRHLLDIYAKLNVSSRWDAVAKATELGILPPH